MPQSLAQRPLLKCRAVMLPIQENTRLGRKVNFAPGKIPSRGEEPPKMYIQCTSPGDSQTSCKVWLASGQRRRCSNEGKTRNRGNLLGCPKLLNRFQRLVGLGSPYCEDTWIRYCCLTSFFPTVDTCISCKDTARQSCATVPRWQIFGDFLCVLYFQRAVCSTFQTCILNSH